MHIPGKDNVVADALSRYPRVTVGNRGGGVKEDASFSRGLDGDQGTTARYSGLGAWDSDLGDEQTFHDVYK